MSEAIEEIMENIGKQAKDASHALANCTSKAKNQVIRMAACNLRDDVDKIMMGNDEGYWIDEQEPNSLFINCGHKAVQSFSNNNEKMNFEVVVKFMS